MKARTRAGDRRAFTLVELIVTLVVFAVATAGLLPLLGSVFRNAHEPRTQLTAALGLQSAMEDLVALHTNDLSALQARLGTEGSVWEDLYTVVENRFIGFAAGEESDAGGTNLLLKVTLQNQLGERLIRLFADPL